MRKVFLMLLLLLGISCAMAEESPALRVSPDCVSSLGLVTVYWEDDAAAEPYTVLYQYVGASQDPQPSFIEENIEGAACTLRYLVPGGDYLITVINSQGNSGEAVITLPPAQPFADGKLSARRITLDAEPCSRPRSDPPSTNLRHGVRLNSVQMTESMEKTEYGMQISLAYPELGKDRAYETLFVFRAPGGFTFVYNPGSVVYHAHKVNQTLIRWSFMGEEFFETLQDTLGMIPTGEYTVTCYLDGMEAAADTFTVR